MDFNIGDKVLITTDQWFLAPDGYEYHGVFGTVRGILGDSETLGIKTNRNSTNWYVSIGNMVVAGCQIHYAIKTDQCYSGESRSWTTHNGEVHVNTNVPCRIYFADD